MAIGGGGTVDGIRLVSTTGEATAASKTGTPNM